MNAKKYLTRIRRLEYRIQRMTDDIAQIRRDLTALGTMDYSKDKVQSSAPAGARYENIVAKLADEEKQVTALIGELSDMRKFACQIIDRMDKPEEAAVLFYRYIKSMTWEQTAEAARVSERNVYRVHGRALQSFERFLE